MDSSTLPALGWGRTPNPPYYVAIFTSQRTEDDDGVATMVACLVELVRKQPGLLVMDSVEGAEGGGHRNRVLARRGSRLR
jgi:hypothetical protein